MNFFGHAVVASWQSHDPPFVLGAMLPDLAHMLRLRVPESRHARVEAGIGLHFETDRCFHAAPTFRRLEAQALAVLAGSGVAKGPRRAVAHVGVELLIDDALSSDPRALAVYRAAIQWGRAARALIAWPEADAAERFRALCERLAQVGGLQRRVTPGELSAQLARALARRPRLRLTPEDTQHVSRWAAGAAGEVDSALELLLAELRAALATPAAI